MRAEIAAADARAGAIDTSANRLRLSVVDVTFALFCLIPPLLFGHQLLNSDGDAARHITMGRLMLREGLYARDPFSHTQPLEPVVLTEWGSRILYALAHEWAGLAGVCLLAGLLIGTATALIVLFLRRRGTDPLLAWGIGIIAAIVGQVHWLARPHLFTLVALACLLFLLEPGTRRRRWWYAALFLPWANLHGGFVLGLVLIATVLAGALLEAAIDAGRRDHWLDRARYQGWGLAIALGASMVNPAGPAVFVHIFGLLGNSTIVSATFEFMSPSFHTIYGRIFLIVLAGAVATLALVERRPELPRLLVVLLMMAGALVARRNIPLFAAVALPMVALHANGAWRRLSLPRALARMRETFEAGERIARPGLWIAPVLGIVVILAAARGSVVGAQLIPERFSDEVFPVNVVAEARQAGVTGRLFNDFVWGGYLTYAWPEAPIFIDGMTDYFDTQILVDYRRIEGLRPEWDELLDRYRVELVLVPPASALAYQLRRTPEWRVVAEDSVAVLLQRPWRLDGR